MSGDAAAFTIGLDLGTSGAKALALDAAGHVLAVEEEDYPLIHPKPSWAEQEPDAWWQAVCAVCRRLLAQPALAGRSLAAVGLSGQMHGATLLDAAGQVLRPALIWADGRGDGELAAFADRLAPSAILRITGSLPNTSATLAKLLWLRQHEPQTLASAAHLLLAKDVIGYRLTGVYATDPSDASGTALYDIRRGEWSPELLAVLELDPALLPTVAPSGAVVGVVTAEAAQAAGLLAGTPIVAGGGDAACAALGVGLGERASAAGAREVLISVGTAGQVSLIADRPLIAPDGGVQTLSYVVPGRWQVMGAILCAGHALAWLARTLAVPADEAHSSHQRLDCLLNEAATTEPGASGLLFLPHLLGSRGPHLDSTARGAFIGLTPAHTPAHLARAVVEGVALALRECVETLRAMGFAPQQALVAGAPSRHPLWRQVLADALGLPIAIGESEHGSALGAARLAARATIGDPYQDAAPPTFVTHRPESPATQRYNDLYAVYRSASAALRPTFHALAALPRSLPPR